jgi:hypothetical protein
MMVVRFVNAGIITASQVAARAPTIVSAPPDTFVGEERLLWAITRLWESSPLSFKAWTNCRYVSIEPQMTGNL